MVPDGWLGNLGTVVGLGVAVAMVIPWLRWRRDGISRTWGLTVAVGAVFATGVWLETGTTLPGALAGAGVFALGGWWLWPHLYPAQPHQTFDQTLTELLTGQRAWDAPTVTQLFRMAPPSELPRLQATVRYMVEQEPELRPLLTPFLEEP